MPPTVPPANVQLGFVNVTVTELPAPPKVEFTEAQKKRIEAALIPGISMGLVSGINGAAGSAGGAKLAVLIDSIDCQVEDVDLAASEPLDWEFHPLGWPIGTTYHKYFLGAVIFNTLLILSLLGLLWLVKYALQVRGNFHGSQAAGNVKCPGLTYIPFIFLFQGVSLAASSLAFFPDRADALCGFVGWAYFLACLSAPFLLYYYLLRKAVFKAVPVNDPRLVKSEKLVSNGEKSLPILKGWKRVAYTCAFGEKIWITDSDDRNNYFVERYGVVFESYRGGMQYFALAEMITMLGLSVFSAWKPGSDTACHVRNSLICLLLLLFFLAVLLLRPYMSALDNLVSALMAFMMMTAIMLVSLAIAINSTAQQVTIDNMREVAGALLMATALLFLLHAIYDLVFYCMDMKIKRRLHTRQVHRDHLNDNYMEINEIGSVISKDDLANQSDVQIYETSSADMMEADSSSGALPLGRTHTLGNMPSLHNMNSVARSYRRARTLTTVERSLPKLQKPQRKNPLVTPRQNSLSLQSI